MIDFSQNSLQSVLYEFLYMLHLYKILLLIY